MEGPREWYTLVKIQAALKKSDRGRLATYLYLGSGWCETMPNGWPKEANGYRFLELGTSDHGTY
jgi:hypothetical protein